MTQVSIALLTSPFLTKALTAISESPTLYSFSPSTYKRGLPSGKFSIKFASASKSSSQYKTFSKA